LFAAVSKSVYLGGIENFRSQTAKTAMSTDGSVHGCDGLRQVVGTALQAGQIPKASAAETPHVVMNMPSHH
jgi:hypothetical protein